MVEPAAFAAIFLSMFYGEECIEVVNVRDALF